MKRILLLMALLALALSVRAQTNTLVPPLAKAQLMKDSINVAQVWIQKLKVAKDDLAAIKSIKTPKGDSLVVNTTLGAIKFKMDTKTKTAYNSLLDQATKHVGAAQDTISKYLKL